MTPEAIDAHFKQQERARMSSIKIFIDPENRIE